MQINSERSKVNIAQVAREAGVSESTVSRVLNGTAQVRPEKREAVERVMDRLNYQPSVTARGLRRGRSQTIGVITPASSSPFFGEMLVGIEQALDGSEYHAFAVSGNWRAAREREALDVIMRREADALIVLGGQLDDDLLRQVAHSRPLIVVGRAVPGLESQCLMFDNSRGQYLAVRHLIEHHHTRIAYLAGPADHPDARARLEGYRQALWEARLPTVPELIVEGDFSEQSGVDAVATLISRGVTFSAIACANDQMAIGARLELFRQGLQVPADVSLVGFDDLFLAAFLTPPLTTVRNSVQWLGQLAGRAALQLLAGEAVHLPPGHAELIVRESVATLTNPALA